MSLDSIVERLNHGKDFVIVTHKDPDMDGIGSMLALGRALKNAEKRVLFLSEEPIPFPCNTSNGAHLIVQEFDPSRVFDAVVALDCAELGRMGKIWDRIKGRRPLINVDHHETNACFGDLNFVQSASSSTGELVFQIIKQAHFPMDPQVAEHIFAAIQTDTGSFRYENTTASSMKIAAEMIECGARPWELTLKVTEGYRLPRLKLLESALGTVELHHGGKVGMMILTRAMFEKAQADLSDGERLVDFLRFLSGVEIGMLVRQIGDEAYKVSLRSNNTVNVAKLALRFGGGGHARAAGFEVQGPLGPFKDDFLEQVGRFLGDV